MFGSIGAFTGLLGATPGATAATAAAVSTEAPHSDFRSAAEAPASWQAFAMQLQRRFQERLASEDDFADRFQEAIAMRPMGADRLMVRAWVLPSGQIERIEFEQLDPLVAARLRVLLSHADVGTPPADMLQPVHVRLLLRPKEPPGQGH
jgi:hypothetical protein